MLRMFLVVFLLVGTAAQATDDSDTSLLGKLGGQSTQLYILQQKKEMHCWDDPIPDKFKGSCAKLDKETNQATDEECANNKSQSEYKKALGAFSVACGQASVATNVVANDLGCGYSMQRCSCLSSSRKVGQISCDGGGPSKSSSKSDIPSAEDASRQYKFCPAVAAKDTSDMKKDLDKAEQQARDDEDKLNDAQDKTQKASVDSQQKIDDAKDKITEADAKHDEDVEKAQKDKTDAQKQIMEQINQMQTQVQGIDDQIAQSQLQISGAYLKRNETKSQLDLNCHNQAATTVSKFQQQALQLQQEGRLNLGGQKDILKKVGLSDRQTWEAMASKYYTWCLQSTPTIKSKQDANDVAAQEIKAINVNIDSQKQHRALLVQQMAQIKDPSGRCGAVATAADGSNGASQMCQALQQAAATQQRIDAAYQTKRASLVEHEKTAETQAAAAASSANQQAARAQSRLGQDNMRVDNLRSYLAANRDAGGGKTDNKAYENVQAKFSEFNNAARTYVDCSNKVPGGNCDTSSTCVTAKRYLSLIGQDLDDVSPTAPSNSIVSGGTPTSTKTDKRTPSSTGGGGDSTREDH